MTTLKAKYEAAKAEHQDLCRRLAIADGEAASYDMLKRLQGEVDQALERRKAAFKAWMDSDES